MLFSAAVILGTVNYGKCNGIFLPFVFRKLDILVPYYKFHVGSRGYYNYATRYSNIRRDTVWQFLNNLTNLSCCTYTELSHDIFFKLEGIYDHLRRER